MKNMKAKLMSAVAMLTVATVMMVGTSYAWFTLSTNPEVKGMTANLAANENLEIALDNGYTNEAAVNNASKYDTTSGAQGSTTGNPYTWGNLVDLGVAFGTINSATTKLMLAPVKYDKGTLQYPQYGADGRVGGISDLTSAVISDHSTVTGNSLEGGVAVYKKAADSTVYDAVSATYWLRSNEGCQVTLADTGVKRAGSTNDTQTGDTDVNTAVGGGSFIKVPTVSGSENTQALIEAYLENLRIRFDVLGANDAVTASYFAVLKTKSGGGYDSTDVTENSKNFKKYLLVLKNASAATGANQYIELTANTAVKVKMSVYLDGETITNADALLDDLTGMDINIQFNSNEINYSTAGDGPGAMDGATKTNS